MLKPVFLLILTFFLDSANASAIPNTYVCTDTLVTSDLIRGDANDYNIRKLDLNTTTRPTPYAKLSIKGEAADRILSCAVVAPADRIVGLDGFSAIATCTDKLRDGYQIDIKSGSTGDEAKKTYALISKTLNQEWVSRLSCKPATRRLLRVRRGRS